MNNNLIKNEINIHNNNNNKHLAIMSKLRKNIAFNKSQNHNLLKRELQSHQFTILEYGKNLLKNLIINENLIQSNLNKKIDLNKFLSQPQIIDKMRSLMFDFIMCCHTRLKLSTPTLFLTFQIIDSYSSKYIIKSNVYQLLALTSLWIASKFWDSKSKTPNLDILRNLCCKQYSNSQFCEMELHLLKAFNWSICDIPTYDSFIDSSLFLRSDKDITLPILYQNNDVSDINKVKIGAVMLCELASFDINLAFNVVPSQLAICSVIIITLAIKFDESKKLINFNDDLSLDFKSKKICKDLLNLLSFNNSSLPSTFKFKYLDSKSHSTITSQNIITALNNYSIQIKLQDFYKSQEFSTFIDSLDNTNNIDNNNDNINDKTKKKISSGSGSSSSNSILNDTDDEDTTYTNRRGFHQHYSSFTSNSNWGPSPISTTTPSSASFASPFSSAERFYTSNTPDTITVNSPHDNKPTNVFNSSSINNNWFPLPSPTTPVLLNNNNNNDLASRRGNNNGSIRRNRNWSISSSISKSTTNNNIASRKPDFIKTTTTSNTNFIKGHHQKRSSSTLDLDFFSNNDINIKRQNFNK